MDTKYGVLIDAAPPLSPPPMLNTDISVWPAVHNDVDPPGDQCTQRGHSDHSAGQHLSQLDRRCPGRDSSFRVRALRIRDKDGIGLQPSHRGTHPGPALTVRPPGIPLPRALRPRLFGRRERLLPLVGERRVHGTRGGAPDAQHRGTGRGGPLGAPGVELLWLPSARGDVQRRRV